MITLRGKLVRTFVERKSPTLEEDGVEGLPPQQPQAPSAPPAAPPEVDTSKGHAAKTLPELESMGLMEEWTWRGVWAFGDLDDDDLPNVNTGSKSDGKGSPTNAEHVVAASQTGEGNAEGEKNDGMARVTASGDDEVMAQVKPDGVKLSDTPKKEGVQSQHVSATTEAPKDPIDRKPAVAAEPATVASAEVAKEPRLDSRPFVYRWIHSAKASDVTVPSSLLVAIKEPEKNGKEANEIQDKTGDKVHVNVDDKVGDANDVSEEGKKLDAKTEDRAKDSEMDTASEDDKSAVDETKAAAEDEKVDRSTPWTCCGNEMPPEQARCGKCKKWRGGRRLPNSNPKPQKLKVKSQQPKPKSKYSSTKPQVSKIGAKKYGDDPFKDAATARPMGTCPMSGKWEGHFENIMPNASSTPSTRKNKRPTNPDSRIGESFYLFFNSSPAQGARTKFTSEDSTMRANKLLDDRVSTDVDDDEGAAEHPGGDPTLILPKDHIHVRGYGTNKFGTFEILGGLDPKTGTMQVQRMYVPVSTRLAESHGGPIRRKRGRLPKDTEKGAKEDSRQKRKRTSTWKTRHSFEEYSTGPDGQLVPVDIASNVKKRARASADGGSGSGKPAASGPVSGVAPPQDQGPGTKLKIQIPTAGGGSTSPAKPSPASTSAAPVAAPAAKKPKVKKKRPPKVLKVSTKPVAVIPTLPQSGDPLLARWRAAHFLYYQRVEQEPADPDQPTWGATPSSNSQSDGPIVTINSVVYEGEMDDGIREGRGACLYNNGTLYEGQWRRNKEHGTGTLMTADRKRVIYTGSWEKGKMHGQGTYYYYTTPKVSEEPQENGSYTGHFRQSQRNGHGVYNLPDGSIYDGEFRDNIQNGYGVFRWTDGSIFEGPWRDGKRHGSHGILIAADGFKYEGAWVNNCMEGRGVATYPKGQIFDGTWVKGKREGRGTIRFTNGAVYEGRFKEDKMEGQGMMKMSTNVIIPKASTEDVTDEEPKSDKAGDKMNVDSGVELSEKTDPESKPKEKHDWMIPLQFQSDISRIHQKAGFTQVGL